MSRAARILLLAVLLAGAPRPSPAQTAAAATAEDVTSFAIEYTRTVTIGIVGGGVLLNLLVGGPAATLVGALAGSSLASWLFINQEARHYVIRRAGTE